MTKLFAFDLDGTLYFGDEVVEGAPELIKYLKEKRYHIVYHTNNSGRSIEQIHKKLNRLGFPSDGTDIYSSGSLTARYCRESTINHGYIVGSVELIDMIGIPTLMVESNLIVGIKETFDYLEMSFCTEILRGNGKFIVCNEDANYPISNNRIMPGCGAIVAALKTASGRKPDVVIGKPNTYLLECICKDYNIIPEEIMVIGDSYDSDIAMTNEFGCKRIWTQFRLDWIKCMYRQY